MIFYITLRFGQVDLALEVPLRLSEETPKQNPFTSFQATVAHYFSSETRFTEESEQKPDI